jgi:hypothetical protein
MVRGRVTLSGLRGRYSSKKYAAPAQAGAYHAFNSYTQYQPSLGDQIGSSLRWSSVAIFCN